MLFKDTVFFMLKIIFTGPESSGKTTLSRQLAAHFNAPLVEEYVRVFFEKKGIPQYSQEDLVQIAKGQINDELRMMNDESLITHHLLPILICDTDLLTLKIWSIVVFGNCSSELIQLIDNQLINQPLTIIQYHFLCSPEGINWEDDPLRENPNDRERLFNIYEKELQFYKKNYKILRGSVEERLQVAISMIEKRIFLLGKKDV